MIVDLFSLCNIQEWPEVRKYVSSDAAEEEKKSNIMRCNDDGITCLHLACGRDPPDNIIKAMLDIGGKELFMMTDDDDRTSLHYACITGASYNIIKMLIEVGGKDLVMAKSNGGDNALHYFCWRIKSHTRVAEKIKLFLQVGDANLLLSAKSAKNDAGRTPLEIATKEGVSKEIKKLLTVQSTTPIADIMKVDLSKLCINKDWPEVRKYLSSDAAEEEKKSDVMYRNDGFYWTCLHMGCRDDAHRAPEDIIKTMLDIGGKELVMMTDKSDRTALHVACIVGASYNIIKMLIEVGGKDLVMANDKDGDTALHHLCLYMNRHNKVADKIKIIRQADDAKLLLSAKNHAGKTPLEIATDKGASKKVMRRLTLQSATLPVADMQMEATHAQEQYLMEAAHDQEVLAHDQEVLDKFVELTVQSTTPVADMQMEAAHDQELLVLGKFVEMFQNAPDDAKRRDIFLRAVSLTGTDVSKNNDNPFDDGDQSKIILDLPHLSKYNWFEKVNNCIGARNATTLFTANLSSHPLLRSCQSGDIDAVEKQVLEAKVGSKERTRLLEGRDNSFRCSALLLMARAENGMGNGNTVKIIRLLLRYGARPDARDICGNNVLHYLAKVSAGLVMRQSIVGFQIMYY
jgi:ankyrin repeat protein